MNSVGQPWTVGPLPAKPKPKRRSRLAAALGLERNTLETILTGVQHDLQHDLQTLRRLTLDDLLALGVRVNDAERLFYLVQWERLQAHLEHRGVLPETSELGPLLETLTPIFERHFSRNARLNDTLITLYRTEFSQPDEGEDLCLNLTPPSPTRRFLGWLGL